MALPERTHDPDWADLLAHARRVARRTGRWDWEDLAQDALLRLWVAFRRGEPMGPALTVTVTQRATIDRNRHDLRGREDRRRVISSDHPSFKRDEDRAAALGVESGAEETTAARLDLRAALRRLTPPYRIVMAARMHDWHHEDIARILGIAVSTSRSRQNYAAARMRWLLAEMEVV